MPDEYITLSEATKIAIKFNKIAELAIIEGKKEGNWGCDSEFNGFMCTRPRDHSGHHIAMSGTDLCAVWVNW